MFEKSAVNLSAFCSWCVKIACCSSQLIFTFLYACRSFRHVRQQLVCLKCTLVRALRLCTGLKTHRGVEVLLCSFLTTALEGSEGSASRPGHSLPPGERSGTHCTGGWVDPRAGFDRCGKSRPHRNSIPGPSSP